MNNSSAWTPGDVVEVARWQKYVIRMVLLILVYDIIVISVYTIIRMFPSYPGAAEVSLVPIMVGAILQLGGLALCVLSVYGCYKIAKSLWKRAAVCYAAAVLVPLVGLIVLLGLSAEATGVLRSNGIRVGLMGANREDVERLANRVG
ncbi:MAG: hypothetical protein ACPL7O_06765 [Armatimonadota bacterium]